MPLPNLESLEAGLDRACADVLGDTISYKAVGQADFALIKAHLDYREIAEGLSSSIEVIAQDMRVSMLRADVPVRPGSGVRIRLPKVPDRTFKPIAARLGESGTHWEFELKDVPDA